MRFSESVFDWQETARLVLTSRRLDEIEEEELAPAGDVPYQFSAKGHELGQVLLSQLLDQPFDAASVYYRSRPFMLGSGLTVEEALASGMARAGSISAGRDVGVVFNLPKRGRAMVLPAGGDVGSQFTPAAGWAQAITYRFNTLGEKDLEGSIAVALGGDGSVATSGFWAALAISTTLKLPLLFFIEDNGYALSVESRLQTPGGDIGRNLASFGGLKIWSGDGTKPPETAELAAEAVAYVRSGSGPGLLRLEVPRLSGHSGHDNQAYKSSERLAQEQARDPLKALEAYLVPKTMSEQGWMELKKEVDAAVRAAAEASLAQAEPDPAGGKRFAFFEKGFPQKVGGLAAEELAPPAGNSISKPDDLRRVNMVDAVRRTLDRELEVNDRCLIFGEDVGQKGGVHTATQGLLARHGQGRVFDTSLSEEGIIGRALGMALAGLVPVPEIQFRKYADPAAEQLHNIGTLRWRTANRFAVPMVVRIPLGFGRRIGDPWHSVSDEAAFAHAVGWICAYPSNAEDAVGLLRAALRGNDPVVFFEHRALLDAAWARRPYPGDDFVLPFGQANKILAGDRLTVVTWGAMVERCQAAAGEVAIPLDLIDLRTIIPWDQDLVLESVAKTGKCLVVHEDISVAGFGSEIAAVIAQESFLDLDAPVERLAMPPVPVPYNRGLMDALLPSIEKIQARMVDLIEH